MDDKILAMKNIDVSKEGAKTEFTVDENWGPGTYATAVFYRPMDQKARRMPSRSVGISWVKLNNQARKLNIAIDVPEKIRPNQTVDIPVTLKGLKEGSEAYLTLAMVDTGILNLTRYKSPNPGKWYAGQRRLGMEIRDYYGKLIDGMQAVSGKVRSGGGAMGTFGNPPPANIKPVALFSGIVPIDKNGKANISFKIPAFDGEARLMAVAWNKTQIGNAEKKVIVRDPVVVIGTSPLFLTSKDKSNLQISLDNVEGEEGNFTYSLSTQGPIKVDIDNANKTLRLASKERKNVIIPLEATESGKARLNLIVTGQITSC